MLSLEREKYFDRMVNICYLHMLEELDDDVTNSEMDYFLGRMINKMSLTLVRGLSQRATSIKSKNSNSGV